MMIELLDKTRQINRLLQENRASQVAFNDVCRVLGDLLESHVYVISSKGKMLGIDAREGEVLASFPTSTGVYIEKKMNERILNVLSTKENVNLETLGFQEEEASRFQALVAPITIAGERLATCFIYRQGCRYGIEDIILSEYGGTVIGLEMIRALKEEDDREKRGKKVLTSVLTTLSPLEKKAMMYVFCELDGQEGTLITSKVAQKNGITRTVIVNALKKLESASLITTKSSGMKGTHIQVLNKIVFTEFGHQYN